MVATVKLSKSLGTRLQAFDVAPTLKEIMIETTSSGISDQL